MLMKKRWKWGWFLFFYYWIENVTWLMKSFFRGYENYKQQDLKFIYLKWPCIYLLIYLCCISFSLGYLIVITDTSKHPYFSYFSFNFFIFQILSCVWFKRYFDLFYFHFYLFTFFFCCSIGFFLFFYLLFRFTTATRIFTCSVSIWRIFKYLFKCMYVYVCIWQKQGKCVYDSFPRIDTKEFHVVCCCV